MAALDSQLMCKVINKIIIHYKTSFDDAPNLEQIVDYIKSTDFPIFSEEVNDVELLTIIKKYLMKLENNGSISRINYKYFIKHTPPVLKTVIKKALRDSRFSDGISLGQIYVICERIFQKSGNLCNKSDIDSALTAGISEGFVEVLKTGMYKFKTKRGRAEKDADNEDVIILSETSKRKKEDSIDSKLQTTIKIEKENLLPQVNVLKSHDEAECTDSSLLMCEETVDCNDKSLLSIKIEKENLPEAMSFLQSHDDDRSTDSSLLMSGETVDCNDKPMISVKIEKENLLPEVNVLKSHDEAECTDSSLLMCEETVDCNDKPMISVKIEKENLLTEAIDVLQSHDDPQSTNPSSGCVEPEQQDPE